ncbi:MAG: hypothetical protein GY828_00545 [Candidatus Gracilibacteria bacterium]|nr:hypothetical protein [Candidatus Gracilibacteria bacterium]
MVAIKYTASQIKELERNKYVEKCTGKQIRFTNECKIEVLKRADKGMFYRTVFHELGFPEYVVSSNVPGISYTRWKNIRNKDGLIGLIGAKKGRPLKEKKDVSKMNITEQNEYFKAKVAYLEELHKTAYGHYP